MPYLELKTNIQLLIIVRTSYEHYRILIEHEYVVCTDHIISMHLTGQYHRTIDVICHKSRVLMHVCQSNLIRFHYLFTSLHVLVVVKRNSGLRHNAKMSTDATCAITKMTKQVRVSNQ